MVEMSINSNSDEIPTSRIPKSSYYDEDNTVPKLNHSNDISEKLIENTPSSSDITPDSLISGDAAFDSSNEKQITDQEISDEDKVTNSSDAETGNQETGNQKAANYVSYFLGATYLSTMIAIYFGGLFLEHFPKKLLFQVTTILCIIPIVIVFVMYEKQRTRESLAPVGSDSRKKNC